MISSFETRSPDAANRIASTASAREPIATGTESAALVSPEQDAGAPVEPESLEQENVGGYWRVHDTGYGGSPTLATFQDILGTFHSLLIARFR